MNITQKVGETADRSLNEGYRLQYPYKKNKRIRPFQYEQFMCYYIVILPYMFRPILGHHQRHKQYQHLKEILYMASEELHMLGFNLGLH
jgi:hypothetical protein